MFFHQAGPSFPFTNMHYVLVAGGNAFYRKETSTPSRAPAGLSDGAGPAGHHDR
jgi:spore germination cell wall hydrolase CwlJ-like protein